MSNSRETPLPKSAAATTRSSGVVSRPATSGTRRRIQSVAGPGLRSWCRSRTGAPRRRRWNAGGPSRVSADEGVPDVGGGGVARSLARPWSNGAGGCTASVAATAVLPSGPARVASARQIRRPGRRTVVVTVSGARGTGRMQLGGEAGREELDAEIGVDHRLARGSRRGGRHGGPPWRAPGSHGPVASSVGR